MAANHKDVELERGSLSICSFYRFAVCQKAKCEHLHICPAYVAGFCQFQGSCRLSHSLLDFHNQQILKKVNSHLSRINCAENLRMIINGIFPKVCFKYNSVNGCRDERCRFLHVCGMMVNGNCKNANRCPLNHSHVSDHEKHLLNKYKINSHQERNFKKLYANVLYAEGKISSRVQRCVCEGYHLFRADSELSLPISEGDSLLTDICGNEKMHRGGKMTGRGRGSQGFRGRGGNKLPTINPRSLLYNDSNSDDDIYSDWKFPDTGNKAKENDMAIDILRDVLLKNGGKMTFKDLAQCDEVTSTFPKHLQLKNFLIKNRNNLILTYKADERIEEVSWLLKVKICYHYNTHDGCYRKETCDQIHVCKGYIEQSCKGCQKAHHFHEKATLRIFQKVLGINLLKTELMRSAVAASLPKICTNWFRNGGRCDRGNFCSDFHLCQNQLMGRCHVKSCRLNHDIQSCIKKLQTYGIHKNEMKNLQSTILLVPNITEETADKTEVTLNELVRQCLLANGGIISFDALIADRQFMSLFPDGYSQLLEWLKENNHEFLCHYDEWNHVHEVQCLLNLRICHQYNSDSGCRSRDDCKYVHICKGYIAGICKSCPLAHSFGESNTLALLKSRNIPLYKKEVLRGIIFHSLPQICESYALSKNGSCSKKPSCRKLHMCPDALFRSCKNPKCRLTHDRNAPSVMKILKQYNLQACPIGSLSVIILPPAIPKGHGFRCDPKPPELQKARAEYIPGKGKQAKEKRISVKRKNLQRKKPSISTEVNSKAMVELESVNDNSACVPELCEAFIRGICPKQICPFVHKKLPYQWQFEKKGMWCDFSDDMNVDIERRYSDPDYTSWVKEDNQSTALLRKDLLFKGTMMLQFKAEQIVYEDGVSNVRRLSTLSNASADDSQLFATEWCWFYCKDGEWKGREFISDEENDIMLQVELAYLDGKEEFKFTDGENNAVLLKLQEMKAIDSFTGEELLLQRRPTFVDEEIKEKRIRMISSYTMLPTSSMNENPSPSNVLARFDENYMAVKQMMDMSLPSKIISIHMVEKVVNEMGEKTYNERKKCMDFSGGVFQEKIYFYSCDPDMVDYVKKHGPIVNNSLKERGIDLPELGFHCRLSKTCGVVGVHSCLMIHHLCLS
ncbi:uncharacterized protein LOC141908132 isoform X2 [Tubulanus polymorphus]|uniref:uncharacterized protein LOC141908132 isoform X2 n=1 Tax=Tubulanus polymorphus TaxID=672921 RepID=UPI003DA65FC2